VGRGSEGVGGEEVLRDLKGIGRYGFSVWNFVDHSSLMYSALAGL
jgi:hypothetical protein